MHVSPSKHITIKYLLKNNYWTLTSDNYACPPLLYLSQNKNQAISLEELIECFADISMPKRILLHGKAGSGKSVLIQYLYHFIVHPPYDAIINLPLARALLCIQPSFKDILSWCHENNYICYQHSQKVLTDILQNKIKVLWLIDEWDELRSLSSDTEILISELFRQQHIIIASRNYDKQYFECFEQVHVLCPNDKTLQALSNIFEFPAYSKQPFNLSLLSTIVEAELFFTLAKENKIDSHTPLSTQALWKTGISLMTNILRDQPSTYIDQLLLFLRYLAFYAFDQGHKRYFDEKLISWVCQKISQDRQITILANIIDSACTIGFIEELASPHTLQSAKYYFRHVLLQEYFAGQFVLQDLLIRNPL